MWVCACDFRNPWRLEEDLRPPGILSAFSTHP